MGLEPQNCPGKWTLRAIIKTTFIGMDIASTLKMERLLGARDVGRLC